MGLHQCVEESGQIVARGILDFDGAPVPCEPYLHRRFKFFAQLCFGSEYVCRFSTIAHRLSCTSRSCGCTLRSLYEMLGFSN